MRRVIDKEPLVLTSTYQKSSNCKEVILLHRRFQSVFTSIKKRSLRIRLGKKLMENNTNKYFLDIKKKQKNKKTKKKQKDLGYQKTLYYVL